jgi:hypothetical protein
VTDIVNQVHGFEEVGQVDEGTKYEDNGYWYIYCLTSDLALECG